MSLNIKYFTPIYSETIEENTYLIYNPLDSPLILFSKLDDSPLAALHLRVQENDNSTNLKKNIGKSLITRRPYQSEIKCDFQGLITKDGQEFELVISNLNSDGYINFNILKDNSIVKTVDPGGLNKINELRPLESYAVQCDQNNKILILRMIMEIKEGKDQTMTVNSAENIQNGNNPIGTYFYLSVTPQINKPELIERFKETYWNCVDVFCIKENKLVKKERDYMGIPREYFDRLPNEEPADRRSMGWIPLTRTGYINTVAARRDAEVYRELNDIGVYDIPLSNRLKESSPKSLIGRTTSFIKSKLNPFNNNKTSQNFFDNGSRSNQFKYSQIVPDGDETLPTFKTTECYDDLDYQEKTINSKCKQNKEENLGEIIKTSYASKLDVSGRTLTVNSTVTGIEYNYETSSAPCLICLSISDKIIFREKTNMEGLIEIGQELIKQLTNTEFKKYLENLSKVYESDECVICFEGKADNKPLNTIFYQCGHKCCHQECGSSLNKCPLCRKYITAHIRL